MSFVRSCMQQRVNYVVDSFSLIPRLTHVTASAICVCVCVCMPLTKHMPLLCGTCACPTTEAQARPHPPKLKLIPARGGSVRLCCGPSILPSFLAPFLPRPLACSRLQQQERRGGEGRRRMDGWMEGRGGGGQARQGSCLSEF